MSRLRDGKPRRESRARWLWGFGASCAPNGAGSPVSRVVARAPRRPDELLDGRRLQAALEKAIGALESNYREVLVLRDVEGLSANEVAEVLGLSVEAVKSRLHRARVAVRERIAPELLPEQAASEPSPACRDVVVAFSQHLEGEIDSNLCAELEQHLLGCPACRSRCDGLRATLRLCRNAAAAPVPPNIEMSVREALRRYLGQQG